MPRCCYQDARDVFLYFLPSLSRQNSNCECINLPCNILCTVEHRQPIGFEESCNAVSYRKVTWPASSFLKRISPFPIARPAPSRSSGSRRARNMSSGVRQTKDQRHPVNGKVRCGIERESNRCTIPGFILSTRPHGPARQSSPPSKRPKQNTMHGGTSL